LATFLATVFLAGTFFAGAFFDAATGNAPLGTTESRSHSPEANTCICETTLYSARANVIAQPLKL
jgi:hypothetical protein